MDFSRLECKEILHYVDQQQIDPDVLEKLVQGAGNVRIARKFDMIFAHVEDVPAAREVLDDDVAELEAARARRSKNDIPVMVLDARLEKLGFTQEDVDTVNEQRRVVYQAQRRMRESHVPIVGEENASNVNADFAPPDGLAGKPQNDIQVGDRNAAGDKCVKIDADGNSVFLCSEGHGYNASRHCAGCPQCFINNGGQANNRRDDEENELPGEDTKW